MTGQLSGPNLAWSRFGKKQRERLNEVPSPVEVKQHDSRQSTDYKPSSPDAEHGAMGRDLYCTGFVSHWTVTAHLKARQPLANRVPLARLIHLSSLSKW